MEANELTLLKQEFEAYKQLLDKEINNLVKITEDQEKRLRIMEMSKEKTDFQYEQIMQTLKILNEKTIPNLTAQIEELKNKPVKRYDQVVAAIISAIVAGIIGFVTAKITK